MNEPPAGSGETRVSTLVGDRLCAGCGYNLTGQPVVREGHYRMLIARCPECGVVAALQEYPLLGRWAGRWAILLAALWLVVLLAIAMGSAAALTAGAEGVARTAVRPFALRLSEKQHADAEQASASAPSTTNAQFYDWVLAQGASAQGMLITSWVTQQDLQALLADAGGWWSAGDHSAVVTWGWIALAAFPIGCLWAVALFHVRRRRLLLAGAALLGLASVLEILTRWGGPDMTVAPWVWAPTVAGDVMGAPYAWLTLAFAALPLSAGLLLGRPLARGLIRGLLPPRLRGALAGLWTAEGLEPPR